VILEEIIDALLNRPKSQAIALGNAALACIRQRNLDQASAWLHQAIDVIERTWGGGGLTVIFAAGRELQSWRHVPKD